MDVNGVVLDVLEVQDIHETIFSSGLSYTSAPFKM